MKQKTKILLGATALGRHTRIRFDKKVANYYF